MKKYEVTTFHSLDSQITEILTEAECMGRFGTDEWPEYRDGYFPHVIVVEISD